MRAQQATLAPETPSYTVELRGLNKKTTEVTAALPRSITVQQALEQSKATKKFKRMQVAVARKSVETGQVEYFKVPFDKNKGSVDILHDYALQPGDRVVVIEDNGSMITDALEQATSPITNALGLDMRKHRKKGSRLYR